MLTNQTKDDNHPKTLNNNNVNKVPKMPPKTTSRIEWISESTLLCATITAIKYDNTIIKGSFVNNVMAVATEKAIVL